MTPSAADVVVCDIAVAVKDADDFDVITIQPIDRKIFTHYDMTKLNAEVGAKGARARLRNKQFPTLFKPTTNRWAAWD